MTQRVTSLIEGGGRSQAVISYTLDRAESSSESCVLHAGMVFYCTSCSFCCNKRLDLIKHLFVTHSVEPNFYFVCGINGCPHSFKLGSTFHSFKSHASRKHPNWQEFVNDEVTAAAPPPPLLSPLLDPDEADLSTVGGYSADEENTLCAIEPGAAALSTLEKPALHDYAPQHRRQQLCFFLPFKKDLSCLRVP